MHKIKSSGYDGRPSTRKRYEQAFGPVPKDMQIHHILPVRLGGTHDLSNLIALTAEEHKEAHMKLYEEYGDHKDLCAAAMIGGLTREAALLMASAGGKAAAEMFKRTGRPQGFQFFTPERQKEVASLGGKKGGRVQYENKIGIHSQTPGERKAIASMGGRKSCDVNGWRDSKVQSQNGKRGGVKNKGFKWYTDGSEAKKYTPKQQEVKSFEDFLLENPQFKAGRK